MGNYEEAKEIIWRIDSLKGGVKNLASSGVGENALSEGCSTMASEGNDSRGRDTRTRDSFSSTSPDRMVGRVSGTARGRKGSHADHIELAGQKESTLR